MQSNKKNNKKQKGKKIKALIVSIIATFLLISSMNLIGIGRKNRDLIPYLEFEEKVTQGIVEKVEINLKSAYFYFETEEGEKLKSVNPRNDLFKERLLNAGINVQEIKFDENSSLGTSMLFLILQYGIIFGGLYFILSKQMGMAIGKTPKSIETRPNVRFDDVAGIQETKDEIMFLVNFLKNPQKYKDIGAELPKGVILYGPPGTGKTLTAQAIAGEAGVPFFNISGSDFIEMYVGLGAKRVRNLFKEARENAPCIIFIDEIDAVGGSRDVKQGKSSEDSQTINALLAEMDGFEKGSPIVVIAATNRIEDLDGALIRPGRFDRHIAIGLPDQNGRMDILKIHAQNKKVSEDVNLESIAKMTIGFSGAALKTLINEAAIMAVNKDSEIIRMEDIDDAYYKMLMKGHKKSKKSSEDIDNLELVAYHEAGHAIVSKMLTDNSVPKVTIIPSTSGAGGVTISIPKKMGLMTKKELFTEIKMLYAGRASEQLLRGNKDDITTGASNDIKRATELIRQYYSDYGMSDEYGMINLGMIDSQFSYVNRAIELSNKLYVETYRFLKDNRAILDAVSKELMDKETLEEADLDRILEGFGKEI